MLKTVSRAVLVFLAAAFFFAGAANAFHVWNGYHWARTANPFALALGDNVSSAWDAYLSGASGDWSVSAVLDTVIVRGNTKPSTCKGTDGRVEVCNAKYGKNGWLGIARIWVSGEHITKGTVKLNDTYFNTAVYNTPAWRKFVMCQEVGHTLGLDHQDEAFTNANLGTCMDYTDDPSGALYGQLSNEHPNQHDYDELGTIYTHLDVFATIKTFFANIANRAGATGQEEAEQNIAGDGREAWGAAVKKDARGRGILHERDLGEGQKIFTFVIWAE